MPGATPPSNNSAFCSVGAGTSPRRHVAGRGVWGSHIPGTHGHGGFRFAIQGLRVKGLRFGLELGSLGCKELGVGISFCLSFKQSAVVSL